jgi:uncharacterized protein
MALRKALTALFALAMAGLAGVSAFISQGALHIYSRPRPVDSVAQAVAAGHQASWEAVDAKAQDGIVLRAWIFTPRESNGAAVILLHGVGDTRAGMLSHANYLLAAGYMVLTPDARGHGSSGGDAIGYGAMEAADVHAWGDWLFAHRPVARLYGMGESMGAGIIIESLATEKRLRAVVAECPFATFDEVAYDRLARDSGLPRASLWPVVWMGTLYARFGLGVDLRRASPIAVVRGSIVPVLLIHGTADNNIPCRHSRELHAANPSATTLWLVPGASHVNAMASAPAMYVERVTGWFRDHR